MDLLTTYTHESELQAITTLADLRTLQITSTTAHAKSSQSAFSSRYPVTDLNDGDSSASVLTPLLSGEYSTTELST
jgi:hypothetical protein